MPNDGGCQIHYADLSADTGISVRHRINPQSERAYRIERHTTHADSPFQGARETALPLGRARNPSSAAVTKCETLLEWILHAEIRFRSARIKFGHGTDNALDEAAWLLLHVLRLPHEALEANLSRCLSPTERRRALALIDKRIQDRAPLAYLLNEAWLGEFRFFVDRRVIVPRSYIAELLRTELHPWIARPGSITRALDLCTGSGCLAVLMAKTFSRAHVDATDLSAAALAVARKNIVHYQLTKRVRLLKSDLFCGVGQRRYHLIASNPPYVGAAAMSVLPPEFCAEPRMALAGGKDGFDLVRKILLLAPQYLLARGLLIMEVGHNRRALERALPQVPFTWLETSGGDDCVFVLRREELARALQGGRGG
ncbi:MAG: 50S ribosomal protein L3 N(5)-glutamine methyltransferase [Betaproteobacteria bacterium]|nr:50S ribosomal protein L3 N(5)-glutamine methyltransferase [Betaproteobacteria bacterium]